MHSVRLKIRNRKTPSNLVFNRIRNISTEVNEGFLKIRCLTRLTAEFIEDVLDSLCFMKVGLATQDQIICK